MRGGGVCWDMSSTCVQGGGLVRPLGGYQPNLIMKPRSPAPAWQLQHPLQMKQEPHIDEDRNDSGITSASSDFQSSSPGSENSQDCAIPTSFSSPSVQPPASSYYQTPVMSRIPASGSVNYYPNTLIYPGYQPAEHLQTSVLNFRKSPVPMHSSFGEDSNMTITNSSASSPPRPGAGSPSTESKDSGTNPNFSEGEDPLQKLQISLEKAGLMPSMLSPKTTSEHSADDENKSDGEMDEYDEQGIRIPRVNSHGKIKTFKCKQCDFVAVTKLEFWEHSKAHIKADKLLTCPKCPFVTEYKHHLEYHLRNHFGSKPFKCDKCSYSCVNKSMLNSHMKSHSNVYQYRCSDCSYATKYCHSLKLHLRKYSHKPAMVLNPDGTPNPLPIIDVYGTRRGPKQKNFSKMDELENASPAQILQNQFAQFVMNSSPQMQLPFPYHPFLGAFPNPLLFKQNLEQLAHEREQLEDEKRSEDNREESPGPYPMQEDEDGALDLSKPETGGDQPPKNRRKGRAYKIETVQPDKVECNEEQCDVDNDDDDEYVLKIDEELDDQHSNDEKKTSDEVTNNNKPDNYSCQYCNIAFGDIVLYTMHMGYHGYKNPFRCNMCGEECNDKVSFFLHIARNPHT